MKIKESIFSTSCIKEKSIWFVSDYRHCLYEYNFLTEETSFHEVLSFNENIRQLIGGIEIIDSKVIMAPFEGNSFYIYDIQKEALITIPCDIEVKHKFANVIKNGEKVYFIGCEIPMIAVYDNQEQTVVIHKVVSNDNKINSEKIWSRGVGCIIDDYLYIPIAQNKLILKINLIDFSYVYIGNKHKKGGYNALFHYQDYIYVIPRQEGQIVKWNLMKNEVQIVINECGYIAGVGYRFVQINEKDIYLLDTKFYRLYRLDVEKRRIDLTDFRLPDLEYLSEYIGHKILWVGAISKELLYLTSKGELISYHWKNNLWKKHEFILQKGKEKYIAYLNRKEELLEEELSLTSYLKWIDRKKPFDLETVGNHIYDMLNDNI